VTLGSCVGPFGHTCNCITRKSGFYSRKTQALVTVVRRNKNLTVRRTTSTIWKAVKALEITTASRTHAVFLPGLYDLAFWRLK
jgi:hypothetical protein